MKAKTLNDLPVEKVPEMLVQAPATFDGDVELTGHGKNPQITKVAVAYKHMGRKVFKQWVANLTGNERLATDTMGDLVAGVYDKEGQLVAATPEMLDQWMDDFPKAFADVVNSYHRELNGNRLKN